MDISITQNKPYTGKKNEPEASPTELQGRSVGWKSKHVKNLIKLCEMKLEKNKPYPFLK